MTDKRKNFFLLMPYWQRITGSPGIADNAFKWLSKGYSTAERTAMFHDNATRVYRIDP
jgi:predicted TIM-barrel fold metal-dependent hydrolase